MRDDADDRDAPTSSASRWCSPANGTSSTDGRDAPRRQRVPRTREGRPAGAHRALGERGVTPGLGTILVGDDPNSAAYVRGKRDRLGRDRRSCRVHTRAARVGDPGRRARRRSTTSTRPRMSTPSSSRSRCPPTRRRSARCRDRSRPRTPTDSTRSTSGGSMIGAVGPRPCTPLGIQALLVHHHVPIEEQPRRDRRTRAHHRSPARDPALAEGAARERDRHRCHTGTNFLPEYTSQADIIVAAAGSARRSSTPTW